MPEFKRGENRVIEKIISVMFGTLMASGTVTLIVGTAGIVRWAF